MNDLLPLAPITQPLRIAVIGGGPAGLMAAEMLTSAGPAISVQVYDAMPSVGRKFLLAGKGGLNLTHSESAEAFLGRYCERSAQLAPLLAAFGPNEVRAWAEALGVPTFVGSSGRVFPNDMKAAPLLRAWLHRLRVAGVRFHMRHRWTGWMGCSEGTAAAGDVPQTLRFDTPTGAVDASAEAVVLALGGASWARLGSDGAWVPWLAARGVEVAALQPSNCGFDVARAGPDAEANANANAAAAAAAHGSLQPGWTEHFRSRFAGHPMKTVALAMQAPDGRPQAQAGEFVITEAGVEGSLVYALSAPLRDTIARDGQATVHIDLQPGRTADFVRDEVARPRGSRSLATHLKSRLGLDGVKAALLHELLPREVIADALRLAAAIKALPLTLVAARPVDEAVSTAGGVRFEALDDALMLRELPGVFCAGEMLDWEAPTGGYLLTACFASGAAAGAGALRRVSGGQH